MKLFHKKCLDEINNKKEEIYMLESMSQSQNEKIAILQNATSSQSEEISQLKSEIKILLQKIAYTEGQIQSVKELNETLKLQLQQEISRNSKMEAIILQGYQVSTDKFTEISDAIFNEDKNEIDKLHEAYEDQGVGDL